MAAQSKQVKLPEPKSRNDEQKEEENQEDSDIDDEKKEDYKYPVFRQKKDWNFKLNVCKPEGGFPSILGSLNISNVCGYGDLWDVSLTKNFLDQSDMSIGVSLPKLRWLITPTFARLYLHSQDWLKFSSYMERSLGASIGLLSTANHELSYNLTWRKLTMDPSQMASSSIRRQMGHNLLSSLKYSYKVDRRDSSSRPTSGYCFASTTQVSGLTPDSCGLRFLRQDFDLRYAIPLGFARAALNFGVSGGIIVPWGSGFLNKQSSLSDRYFMGGPSSLMGFDLRGIGPTDPRRQIKATTTKERDALGGDLALNAFVDLSFDLPSKILREIGIFGHAFASAGSLTKLSNFSLSNYFQSFSSCVGFGLVIPTKLFHMEVNYCYILKQSEHDKGKAGLQFIFSSPKQEQD